MRNDNSYNYRVERIFKKRKVTVGDILTLDAYGIVYESIGGAYLKVDYNGEEYWLAF